MANGVLRRDHRKIIFLNSLLDHYKLLCGVIRPAGVLRRYAIRLDWRRRAMWPSIQRSGHPTESLGRERDVEDYSEGVRIRTAMYSSGKADRRLGRWAALQLAHDPGPFVREASGCRS